MFNSARMNAIYSKLSHIPVLKCSLMSSDCRLEAFVAETELKGRSICLYFTENSEGDISLYSELFNIGKADKSRVMKVLNYWNQHISYYSFYLNDDNDVCLSYDFFDTISEQFIGSVALQVIVYINSLNKYWHMLMEAVYTDEKISYSSDMIFGDMKGELNYE